MIKIWVVLDAFVHPHRPAGADHADRSGTFAVTIHLEVGSVVLPGGDRDEREQRR